MDKELIDSLEAFTCLMYGKPREKSLNTVRSIMLKNMVGSDEKLTAKSKVNLSRLPPCRDNLIPHIGRVNHRLANYKRAHIPIFWLPMPYDADQGWERTEEGTLEPLWSNGPILPPTLVDLLMDTQNEMEENEDDEELEESDDDDVELDLSDDDEI